MSHEDLDYAPVAGFPEPLPPGERILWQGGPTWRSLARRVFRINHLAVYFGILVAWSVITAFYDGRGAMAALTSAGWITAMATAGIGLLLLYAWLIARTSVYTITNRRVVIRSGVALPLSINLPFAQVQSARLKSYPDGTGDLPLALRADARIGYLYLWPHARPWRLGRPEPTLRGVPEAARVADILGEAVAAASVSAATPAERETTHERPDPPAANSPTEAPTQGAAVARSVAAR